MTYIIIDIIEGELVFWSNEEGWTGELSMATQYDEEYAKSTWLPIGNNPQMVWTQMEIGE